MTGHDDFDRTLTAWFEAETLSPAPSHVLERILDVVGRRRPRPAWLAGPGSHWVGEHDPAGWSSGLHPLGRVGLRWSTTMILLLVIAALVGGAILIGAGLSQRAPLPSGRPSHLAYGLNGNLYVADEDGSHPIRIANGAPPDNGPGCQDIRGEGRMWSPDGLHLAYRSGCRGTVEIVDPAGRPVASVLGDGWLLSWSPDSTRIATWVDMSNTVGIYGLDGTRQALLTVPSGCPLPGDFDPVWSPDGQSVVIWPCEVPIDGRTPKRLPAEDPRSVEQWAYSPAVDRIAFDAAGWLVVAAPDGSSKRVLIRGGLPAGGYVPVWSPTGDRIAFDTGTIPTGPDEIRVVEVASGAVRSVARAQGTDQVHVIGFSAAGDRVLFATLDSLSVGVALWSVQADGSDARLLVTGTDWGQWQPLPLSP